MISSGSSLFILCCLVGGLLAQQGHHQGGQHQGHGNEENSFFEKQDLGHLKHDIKDQYYVELDEKTSEHELEFYNFKLHDYDNNQLLDGLELLMALNHDHEAEGAASTGNKEAQGVPAEPTHGQRQMQIQEKYESDSKLVDHIIEVYDTDNDGYVSFYEYSKHFQDRK